MKTLPINTKIEFKLTSGVVSDAGAHAIRAILFEVSTDIILPEDWDWKVMVGGKGEYVGTLPKRIAKFYYKNGIKLDSDMLGKIGSLMCSYSASNTDFVFDFDTKLDWDSGDFGDSGSCYWGSNSAARYTLKDNDCYALRFFKENSGFARCWIVPTDNFYVIFNGYGMELANQCHIMATYLGLSYRKVRLSNYGQQTGKLWINGGSGFIVGEESKIAGITDYDFEMDISESHVCNGCGYIYDEDELTEVKGDYYCESCLCENFGCCDHCGEYVSNDDYELVNGIAICKYCIESYYYWCEDCKSYGRKQTTTVGNKEVCDDCLSDNYFECKECDCYVHNDDVSELDDICQDCLDSYYVQCNDCGEWIKDANELGNLSFCDDCIDNWSMCDKCNNVHSGEKFYVNDKIHCNDCYKPLLEKVTC